MDKSHWIKGTAKDWMLLTTGKHTCDGRVLNTISITNEIYIGLNLHNAQKWPKTSLKNSLPFRIIPPGPMNLAFFFFSVLAPSGEGEKEFYP